MTHTTISAPARHHLGFALAARNLAMLFFTVRGLHCSGIERIVEFYLLCQGEFSAAAAFTV